MIERFLRLIRVEENDQWGTFGVLILNGSTFCFTLEPPDHENAKYISSIPVQQYTCKRILSSTYGSTFQVMRVPNRTNVLFHAGNTVYNTQGCILLAQSQGKLRTAKRAVINSGKTFSQFKMLMEGHDKALLTIVEQF